MKGRACFWRTTAMARIKRLHFLFVNHDLCCVVEQLLLPTESVMSETHTLPLVPYHRSHIEQASGARLQELFALNKNGEIRIHAMSKTTEGNGTWKLSYTDYRPQ